jgi:CheY-like chemotaxis protein
MQNDRIMRVMIVDDDPIMSTNLVELLELEGYEACCVQSGSEALMMVASFLPDLILSDLHMPGMTGASILTALRQDPILAQIPFVFMSGQTDPSDEITALEVDGYLLTDGKIKN